MGLNTTARRMVEEATAEIENVPVEEALKLVGDDRVLFVDIRDVRELDREGMIPSAYHAPRGMLEFWVDPKAPTTRRSSRAAASSFSTAPLPVDRRSRPRCSRTWGWRPSPS